MADDLTISIGGNAAGLNAATAQAQGSLTGLGSAAQTAGSQATQGLAPLLAAVQQTITGLKQMQAALSQTAQQTTQTTTAQTQQATSSTKQASAIQQATTAMQQQLAIINYVASATQSLDAATVAMNADWLRSAQGSDQFSQVLAYLKTQLDLATASMGNGPQGMGTALNGFATGLLEAIDPLNLFHTHVMQLVEVMGLWRIFEEGSRIISDLVSNIAQLPVVMQQTEMAWTYTYGMGQTVNPSGNMAVATGIGQQLAAWSARDSYNLPFTRQDMMQSITNLAMANLTPAGVEQYLPVLADLAATAGNGFGGGPVTLSRASYAVQGALMGYNRMLQYDLHIRPEQLQPYGYDAGNPTTLLPALMQYAQKTHRTQWQMVNPQTGKPYGQNVDIAQMDPNELAALIQSGQIEDTGAAKTLAKTTWSGAWSSFQDRLQNFALDVGGYPAFGSDAGKLRQGSPLDMAMQGLNAFTQWWDDHQGTFNDMAGFFSKTLGTAMSDAGDGLEAFARGLARSGLGDLLAHGFGGLSSWLSSPQTQQFIKTTGQQLGGDVGSSLTDAATGLSQAVDGLTAFWKGLGTGGQKSVVDAVTIPGTVVGVLGSLLGGGGHAMGDYLHGWLSGLKDTGTALWTGDKGGARALWGGIGQMMGDFGTGGANAWDILMNWAGNPGGYKPGSAQQWMAGVEHGAGRLGGAINHQVSNFESWAAGGIGTGIGKAGHWLLTHGDLGHGDLFGDLGSVVSHGVGGWLGDQWDGILNNLNGGLKPVQGLFDHVGTAATHLTAPLGDLKGWLDTKLPQAEGMVTKPLGDLKGWLDTKLPGALTKVTTPFSDLHDLLSGTFATTLRTAHDLIQNISTAFTNLHNALKPLLDTVARFLPGGGSNSATASYSGTLRGPGGYRVAGAIGP